MKKFHEFKSYVAVTEAFRQQFPGRNVGPVFQNVWWFQDRAPAHGTLEIRRLLQARFQHRVVALHHPIEWPPRSPDLTPLDFFLWGYLKQKVFSTPPASLGELRRRIVDEMNILRNDQAIIRRSFSEMRDRVDLCIQRNGSHVECNLI